MAHLISLNLRDHPNLLSDPDGLSAGWDLLVSPPFGRAQSGGGGTGGAGGTHVVQPGEHVEQDGVFPLGHGLTGTAARDRRPVRVGDIVTIKSLSYGAFTSTAIGSRASSFIRRSCSSPSR